LLLGTQTNADFFSDLKKEILEEVEKIGPVESINIFEVFFFSLRNEFSK
jgi:hypothetical protein